MYSFYASFTFLLMVHFILAHKSAIQVSAVIFVCPFNNQNLKFYSTQSWTTQNRKLIYLLIHLINILFITKFLLHFLKPTHSHVQPTWKPAMKSLCILYHYQSRCRKPTGHFSDVLLINGSSFLAACLSWHTFRR